MKATLLIRKDHDNIRQLFEQFRKLNGRVQNGKRSLFDQIRREISVYSSIETELFYPELRNTASDRADQLVDSALDDHRRIDQILSEIARGNGNEKLFESGVSKLMDVMTRHFDREEEIFEEARLNMSEQRLEGLGLEMELRKNVLTQIAA
jgi:hemerythrin superfamily protein